MPAAGVEPARYCYQQILSLPRLPIPTHRLSIFDFQQAKCYHSNCLLSI